MTEEVEIIEPGGHRSPVDTLYRLKDRVRFETHSLHTHRDRMVLLAGWFHWNRLVQDGEIDPIPNMVDPRPEGWWGNVPAFRTNSPGIRLLFADRVGPVDHLHDEHGFVPSTPRVRQWLEGNVRKINLDLGCPMNEMVILAGNQHLRVLGPIMERNYHYDGPFGWVHGSKVSLEVYSLDINRGLIGQYKHEWSST